MLKTKKKIKTLLALTLVLTMGQSMCGVFAFASEEVIDQPVTVTADEDGVDVKVGADDATDNQATVDTPAEPDKVTIKEDINTLADNESALTVKTTDSDAAVSVTAQDVNASDPYSNGIKAEAGGGDISLSVETVEAGRHGVLVENTDGKTDITLNGSLTAGISEGEMEKDNDTAIYVTTQGTGTTAVTVNGDAQSDDFGIMAFGTGTTDVTVNGTLGVEGGGTPILIGSDVTEANFGITVWKIEIGGKTPEEGGIVRPANDDGHLMPQGDVSEEDEERARKIENSINYIIRIDPEQKGTSLSSDKDKAHANETVKITVAIPDGYTLKAVYTDEGKTLTAQDNGDGTFTLKVPVGGGVYVHADFNKIPAPDPEPEPKPEPEPEPDAETKKENGNDNAGENTKENTGTAPKSNSVSLKVGAGKARYEIVNNGQKIALNANPIRHVVQKSGVTEFIFKVNGRTYTVDANDLLSWLGSLSSVTLYIDGDMLVLDFGNGKTVTIESDEAKAARQESIKQELSKTQGAHITSKEEAATAAALAASRAAMEAALANAPIQPELKVVEYEWPEGVLVVPTPPTPPTPPTVTGPKLPAPPTVTAPKPPAPNLENRYGPS